MKVKNIKNKSNKQWVVEWFGYGFLLVLSFVLIYISRNFLSGLPQFIALWILYIATFIQIIIFIVRTMGIIMMIFFPEIIARGIKFDDKRIDIFLEHGNIDSYSWGQINRIILTENFDGIYIKSDHKANTYRLPIEYKTLEKSIDDVIRVNSSILLKKEKQWIQSNQDGLDPNKNPENVKRTYMARAGSRGGSYEQTIESKHGIETIYYSR